MSRPRIALICDQTTIAALHDIDDPSIVRVLWAAMCSMTQDVHCAQDNLSEDEWRLADRLFARLDAMVNAL
jgi:hypothetical protein